MENDKNWGMGIGLPQTLSEVEAMQKRPDYWWPVAELQKRGVFNGDKLVGYEVRVLGKGFDPLPVRVLPDMVFALEYCVKGEVLERVVACAHLRTPLGVCVTCGALEEPS